MATESQTFRTCWWTDNQIFQTCTNLKQPYCSIEVHWSVKGSWNWKRQLFYLVIKLMKPFAAPRACRGWKAKRCIGIIVFRTANYTHVIENCQWVTNTTTKLSQKVLLHFHRIFLISWRGKRPFLINRTRTFAWKEPLPIAPPLPLGKLDNNLSPRVGDFAPKNHSQPKLPGGDPRGYTWYFHNRSQVM